METQACHGQKPLAGRNLQDGHAGEQKWLTQKIGGVAAEGIDWEVWKVAGNFNDKGVFTLPETNVAPENRPGPKRKLVV